MYLYAHTGVRERLQTTDYHSVIYSSVVPISPDNNRDLYRCTIDFEYSDNIPINDNVDPVAPTFNFTWRSPTPLNVHCKYNVISRKLLISDIGLLGWLFNFNKNH